MASENIIWLDKDSINAFQDMYPGDIKIYGQGQYVAACTIRDGKKAALFLGTAYDELFYIDWLYVVPDYRGEGVADRLLEKIISWVSSVYDVDRIYTLCVDEGTRNFLQRRNFEFDESDIKRQYTSKIADMIDLPDVGAIREGQRLTELSDRETRMIMQFFSNHKSMMCALPFPIDRKDYMNESRVLMDGSDVKSMIALKEEDAAISFPFVFLTRSVIKEFVGTLGSLKDELSSKYGDNKELRIMALNEDAWKLAEKLWPKASCRKMYFGSLEIE